MDIEKLSKISGLAPTEDMKQSLQKSLAGVFSMMSAIENMPDNKITQSPQEPTQFESEPSQTIDRDEISEKIPGIHLTDGFFLAPKVIQKN